MKSRKLRNKILSFVLPLTLVPFTLMALAVYYFVIRSYQVQIEDEQSKLLAEAIVNLRKEQDAARRDVALIASLPAIVEYLEFASTDTITNTEPVTQLRTTARASLKSFFDQNSYYLELSLVDAQGRERIKFNRLPGEQSLKSIKENEVFRRTLISGQVQMPVEALQATRLTTVFTSRVRRATFSGIVVLHLNTAVFQRLMRPLLGSHQLSTFLFDDRGFVFEKSLKGPDEEECFRQINPAAEAKAMLANFSAQKLTKDLSSNSVRYSFSVIPAEEFISFKEPVSGESWFLGSLRLKEPMFGRAGTFQVIFFAGLIGTLGVALWGITRYSRRITVPLEEVAQATAMIARGQFDIDLEVSTGDEVEELAQAVKRMADDLKGYQAELIKSAKLAAIGEMASEISHEIQNRISGLSLWIQYLDGEIAPDDPRREYLQEIKQGLKGFTTMLEELKQLYRTPILDLSDVSLNDLVKESLPYVESRLTSRNVELELHLDSDTPLARCDADRIKSVIVNLLINASDAVAKDNGKVVVVTKGRNESRVESFANGKLDETVIFSVSDNGRGISTEDLPRIFYPFFSTKRSGSGLGLAICSNLVNAHGGKIEVESRMGEGTVFTVSLPRVTSDRGV